MQVELKKLRNIERARKGDTGLCYECAHIAAKMNEKLGAMFTQGMVNMLDKDGKIMRRDHAWVEIGDEVYDTTSGEIMSKDEYYE